MQAHKRRRRRTQNIRCESYRRKQSTKK